MSHNIIIAGDLFPTPVNQQLFKEGNVSKLFGDKITEFFRSSSFSICNLEGVFTDSASHIEKASGPCIKAEKDCISAYKQLGVKCLATANNHIMDYLKKGFEDTCRLLDENGIDRIGSGNDENGIVKFKSLYINGHSVCVYNVAETMYNAPSDSYPGVNVYDELPICKEIEQLKTEYSYLIVIYHGGMEWFSYPTPEIRKRFHRMADSGADLVVSQHTHCLGCEEHYNGSYLLYGQGNFLFTRHNRHRGGGVLIDVSFEDEVPLISLHPYSHTEYGVMYDDKDDLSSFKERSSHVDDKAFIEKQLITHVSSLYPSISCDFQPNNSFDSLLKAIIPVKYYDAYRRKFRTRRPNHAQLLRLLYTLESEQQTETLYYILKGFSRNLIR